MKSLTFSCLICALNLYFAQKLLRKTKNFGRLLQNRKTLLQMPKVAQKLRSTIGTGPMMMMKIDSLDFSKLLVRSITL